MRAAVGAQRDAPGTSRKPGVFRRGCADGGTTGRRAKAADVIGDPVGIGEGMLMPSLHGNAFVLVRDGVTAGGAEQAFFFFRLFRKTCIRALAPLLFLFAVRIEEQPTGNDHFHDLPCNPQQNEKSQPQSTQMSQRENHIFLRISNKMNSARRSTPTPTLPLPGGGKGLTFPRLSPMKYLPTQRIEGKEYRKSACCCGMFSALGPTIAEDRQHARALYCTTLHRNATPRHPCGPAPGARGG